MRSSFLILFSFISLIMLCGCRYGKPLLSFKKSNNVSIDSVGMKLIIKTWSFIWIKHGRLRNDGDYTIEKLYNTANRLVYKSKCKGTRDKVFQKIKYISPSGCLDSVHYFARVCLTCFGSQTLADTTIRYTKINSANYPKDYKNR
jgi:hypothetical protein